MFRLKPQGGSEICPSLGVIGAVFFLKLAFSRALAPRSKSPNLFRTESFQEIIHLSGTLDNSSKKGKKITSKKANKFFYLDAARTESLTCVQGSRSPARGEAGK